MASAFTDEQISQYLEFVHLPQQWHPKANPALSLEYLTALHTHQISTIPYENLSLHYSKDKKVDLDPQQLFRKFLHRKRGGYCMETSIFYNHILRKLGFQVYTAGVRIRMRKEGVPFGNYIGWVHIVNIVTLADGTKYMVDVGFGGDGATKPLPLIDGLAVQNIGTQEIRLINTTTPDQIDQSKPLWIYQYRNSKESEWSSYYAFPEVEFLEVDFGILNYWASTCTDSFQTFTILIVKFLRTEEKITGKRMLFNNLVKENLGGKTQLVQTLTTESERIEALSTWFGLELTEDEKIGIRGHITELH